MAHPGVARPLAACQPGGSGYRNDADTADNLVVACYGGNNTSGPIDVATARSAHGGSHGRLDFETETFVAHSLRGEVHPTLDSNNGPRRHHGALIGSAVRRLTPEECEALQGFPRGFTLIPWRNGMAPDGPRYRALGNSMAVPVVRWIGQRIQHVQDQLTAQESSDGA